MLLLVSITTIYVSIVLLMKLAEIKRNNKIQILRSSQYYVRLRNLLEDCTIVNNAYSIMRVEIKSGNTKGFYHFSIRFLDVGKYVIEPAIISLESVEQHVKAFYQSEVERLNGHDLRTVVETAMDKTPALRLEIQEEQDSYFFRELFNGRSFPSRKFYITSPFENYASSGGAYIFDPDDWKIDGDDAIFMGILEFESDYQEMVPYLIKETAEKLFSNVKVTIFSDGCSISGLY